MFDGEGRFTVVCNLAADHRRTGAGYDALGGWAKSMRRWFTAPAEPDGIGLAVYNRLLRSAGFEVVELDE